MAGSGRRLRYCGMSGQCGNRPVQGVAQIMQGGRLQSQRQCADIQVDETAAFAVLDVSDKAVGQRAVISRCMHDRGSVTDCCSVAIGNGLPARSQRGGKGLHQPGSSFNTLLRKNAELIGDGVCHERAGPLRIVRHQIERGRGTACAVLSCGHIQGGCGLFCQGGCCASMFSGP